MWVAETAVCSSKRCMSRMQTLLGLTIVLLIATQSSVRQASADDLPEWELTPLAEPALRLFTPASGAFFAQITRAFMRSDDGGDIWQQVSLGPADTILEVDPTNHSVLYAAGPNGIYRTRDDASTWTLILPFSADVGSSALALAVSPVDAHLVYLATSGGAHNAAESHFLRSRDGGATWRLLEDHQFSLCTASVTILQPHPTDVERVFRAAPCNAGRTFGASLNQSTDYAGTWTAVFNPEPFAKPLLGYPRRLVGGQGTAPARFYLAVNRDRRLGGSSLFRTDDDGATWTELLANRGGGTPAYIPPGEDPNAPNIGLGGLAYDPANPDHLFVGRQSYPGYFAAADGGGVSESRDAGLSWSDLGRQDIGAVNDLAWGIDGRNLYAATEQGVWRLRLADGSAMLAGARGD
jgi:photosystem II stability/assembly factor-like uncharacterized protein